MIRLWPLILLPALGTAQNAAQMIARGEQVFGQSCANGYCHAAKGADGGGAPRLVSRGFDEAYISKVVISGIAGTPMASFAGKLPPADLGAVIAYVDNLNGVVPSANPAGRGSLQPPAPLQRSSLPPDAEKGRRLFFEATLGFGRCSTCHQVASQGMAVASPIATVPASAPAFQALKTPNVSTATIDGDSMPALVLSHGSRTTIFYDLTSAPPVYRTVDSSQVKIAAGSSWSHASVLKAYSGDELRSILSFLRAER